MRYLLMIFASVTILMACQNKDANEASETAAGTYKGVVEEVLQAGEYTYLQVDENGKKKWLAVPGMEAAKGDVYYYAEGLVMTNFGSKELGRTFEEVTFLEFVSKEPIVAGAPKKEETLQTGADKRETLKMEYEITAVEGGYSIADIFVKKAELSGKKVKVKGVVVKYNPEIMSKNWLHIQDGSEFNGKFDLTVTTLTEVAVGDTIVVEGILAVDKDFGHGYKYDVIVEDAQKLQ